MQMKSKKKYIDNFFTTFSSLGVAHRTESTKWRVYLRVHLLSNFLSRVQVIYVSIQLHPHKFISDISVTTTHDYNVGVASSIFYKVENKSVKENKCVRTLFMSS